MLIDPKARAAASAAGASAGADATTIGVSDMFALVKLPQDRHSAV